MTSPVCPTCKCNAEHIITVKDNEEHIWELWQCYGCKAIFKLPYGWNEFRWDESIIVQEEVS